MADDFDVSCMNKFEEELGSLLRHRSRLSYKLKQLSVKSAGLKLNNQVNLLCQDNNIDLSVKNILDNVQNVSSRLNTIDTTVDNSDKTEFNIGETVQELENIIQIISKNKNTIFSHRNLL